MNARKMMMSVSLMCALGLSVWSLVSHKASAVEGKQASARISVADLQKRMGPNPPIGSTFVGVQAQPKVGELELPIHDAKVFHFVTKTPAGRTLPVNWAYSPENGTYMWGTSPIQCANGGKIAQGGFVVHLHPDGSGAYALGTRTCPVGKIYGCRFSREGTETACGGCAWNQDDLVCAKSNQ